MKYKRVTFEMKKKIVSEAMEIGKLNLVARKYGIAHSTLGGWLSDDEFNLDKEYARTRRENRDFWKKNSRTCKLAITNFGKC